MIQGTNVPIELTFDTSVSSFSELVASLWIGGKEAKRWMKDDMTIAGLNVTLPLTEEETRTFRAGKAKLLVKGLNPAGQTIFWEEADVMITGRDDKNIDIVPEVV